jgi:hypothetical protein
MELINNFSKDFTLIHYDPFHDYSHIWWTYKSVIKSTHTLLKIRYLGEIGNSTNILLMGPSHHSQFCMCLWKNLIDLEICISIPPLRSLHKASLSSIMSPIVTMPNVGLM